MAEIATVEQAIQPITSSLIRLPNSPSRTAPMSGASMMFARGCFKSRAILSRSKLERVHFVDVERFAVSEYRDDDRESNRSFGGGYGHHDEDKQLAVYVAKEAGERDQREVSGVQHELNAQKYRDGV